MRCTSIILGSAVLALSASTANAVELDSPLVAKALVGDASAVKELRRQGRGMFDQLVWLRDHLPDDAGKDVPEKLDALMDEVGGARYSSVSRLYWHTDFDNAKAAAKQTGKPILTLRMMGKLTDELSCANSRFFRTTLYANSQISNFLRTNFVLHWQSVRPVPKITIDFGDGRKLERTLTGNSIHYILAHDGTLLDGLPGLYSPQKFIAWLKELHEVTVQLKKLKPVLSAPKLDEWQKYWHLNKANRIARFWEADLKKVKAQAPAADAPAGKNPPADKAAKLAFTKGVAEMPTIASVMMKSRKLEADTGEDVWSKIAAFHTDEVKLDVSSRRIIANENPTALEAAKVTRTKIVTENPLLKMLARLRSSIAADTVRNEYLLHRKLHEWFAEGKVPADLEELNERVYAELFLTPSSDPWIGLVPKDVYTGIANGGVVRK